MATLTGFEPTYEISQFRAVLAQTRGSLRVIRQRANCSIGRFAQHYAVSVSDFVRKPAIVWREQRDGFLKARIATERILSRGLGTWYCRSDCDFQARLAPAINHSLDILRFPPLLDILADGGGEIRPQFKKFA